MSVSAPPEQRRAVSPEFSRLLGHAVVGLAIFHLAFLLLYWYPDNWVRDDPWRDFTVYWRAALRLKDGLSPYVPWPDYNPWGAPSRFFYPPPFLLLTRPLVELDYVWFGRVWSTFMLAALWIYAASLAKIATGKLTWKSVLVAGLVINLFPRGYSALGLGNFEPVMWACYGVALSTRFRAAPLAFAAMMKLHPIWVLMLVIKDEGRRAFIPALIVLVVGFAGGIWLCGLENSLGWWPATSPVVSQGTFSSENCSISFLLIRAASALGYIQTNTPLPAWAKGYLSLMALGGPFVTMLLTRRLNKELGYALVASATVLFAPLCWSIYLPLLLLPMAIWWRLRTEAKRPVIVSE